MEGGPMFTWPGEGCLSVTGLDVSETPKTTGTGSPVASPELLFCFVTRARAHSDTHARTRARDATQRPATQHTYATPARSLYTHARLAYRDKPHGARSPRVLREPSMPEGPPPMFERFFSDARSLAHVEYALQKSLWHTCPRAYWTSRLLTHTSSLTRTACTASQPLTHSHV
jgi:hypothetical protein